jgi:hypothetical protein
VAKPRIRLDRNLVCELLLPSDTYVQSSSGYKTFPANRRRWMQGDCIGPCRWAKNEACDERYKKVCVTFITSKIHLNHLSPHCLSIQTCTAIYQNLVILNCLAGAVHTCGTSIQVFESIGQHMELNSIYPCLGFVISGVCDLKGLCLVLRAVIGHLSASGKGSRFGNCLTLRVKEA